MVASRSSREREVFQRDRRVRVGAETAADEDAEAGLDRAVGQRTTDGDDADVVEHGLAAVGRAAGEVDLELARQALGVGVAQEVAERGFGPRRDVEDLERARAGEVAAHHVADGVAARFAGGHADRAEVLEQFGHAGQLDEVELDVLPGGDVAPTAAVGVGDVRRTPRAARGSRRRTGS